MEEMLTKLVFFHWKLIVKRDLSVLQKIHIYMYVVWMRNTPRIARVGKVGWSNLGTPGGLKLPWDGV